MVFIDSIWIFPTLNWAFFSANMLILFVCLWNISADECHNVTSKTCNELCERSRQLWCADGWLFLQQIGISGNIVRETNWDGAWKWIRIWDNQWTGKTWLVLIPLKAYNLQAWFENLSKHRYYDEIIISPWFVTIYFIAIFFRRNHNSL